MAPYLGSKVKVEWDFLALTKSRFMPYKRFLMARLYSLRLQRVQAAFVESQIMKLNDILKNRRTEYKNSRD